MKPSLTRFHEAPVIRAYGDEIHVHLGARQTGGAVTQFTDCTPPRQGPPPHFHTTEDEWWYVLEGRAEFFDGETWSPVAPGGAVFSPKHSVHAFRNVGETVLKNITSLSPSGFETFFRESEAVFERGGGPDPGQLLAVAASHHIFFPTLDPGSAVHQGRAERPPVIVQPGEARVLHAFGEEVRVLLDGARTGGAVVMWTETTPPEGGPPPHWHEREDEWFHVLEGVVSFFVNGEWVDAHPGDVVFAPRGQVHTFQNRTAAPTKMLIHASPSGFETFFARAAEEFGKPGGPDMARAVAIAEAHGIHFVAP